MDLTDKETIRSILKQENIRPNDRMGQNFLVDQKVLEKIVESADLKPDDFVVEVGPGLGLLTQEMAKKAGLVLAIEKDRKFVEWLRCYFKSQSDKVKIVCDDILQYNNITSEQYNNKYKVVSNLPYNITSPVIRKFIESENPPSEMVVMVQKEVAERICADSGDRNRGLLTVIIEYFGKAEIVEIVSSKSFFPEPKVDSAIIKIKIKKQRLGNKQIDYKSFLSLVKIGFSQKRRQIHHPLGAGLHLGKDEVYDILKIANIDPKLRAEDISLEGWIEIGKAIQKKIEGA